MGRGSRLVKVMVLFLYVERGWRSELKQHIFIQNGLLLELFSISNFLISSHIFRLHSCSYWLCNKIDNGSVVERTLKN